MGHSPTVRIMDMDSDFRASKNGHNILAVNGYAFENGERVASTSFNYDEQDKQFILQQREIGRREAMMDGFKMLEVINLICDEPNPVLNCLCFKYACGLTDMSEVDIAKKFDLDKAAVNKRVKRWQIMVGPWGIGLPAAAAMRGEKACKTFRETTIKSWIKRKLKSAVAPRRKALQHLQKNPPITPALLTH